MSIDRDKLEEMAGLKGSLHPGKDTLVQELARELLALREGYAAEVVSLKKQLAEMTEDRNLWQDDHNEYCPHKIQLDSLQEEYEEVQSEA